MQKVLSVSVAAYNVEKFIEQCLDSFIDPAILDRVEAVSYTHLTLPTKA